MATVLNSTALDAMLNGTFDPDGVSLHSGDPGVDGTGNVVAAAQAATFAAAEAGTGSARKRALAAQEDFTGLTASASVVNIGLWTDTAGTPTYYGYVSRTGGDAAVNAAGEYSLTTATEIILANA